MDQDDETMGGRLQRLRKAKNEKQEDAAAGAGISRTHLSKLENDQYGVGFDAVVRLARHYGVTIDYLKFGAELPSEKFVGEPIKTAEEAALLRVWDLLHEPEQDHLIDYAFKLLRATGKGHPTPRPNPSQKPKPRRQPDK